MNDIKINKILTLLLTTGQMLLENGAETYRAEETVVYLFNSITFGEIDVFAIPTADGYSFKGWMARGSSHQSIKSAIRIAIDTHISIIRFELTQ